MHRYGILFCFGDAEGGEGALQRRPSGSALVKPWLTCEVSTVIRIKSLYML